MGLRLPGADSPSEYWRLLVEGRSAIAPLPADRLDRQLYHQRGAPTPAKSYTELGGTVSDQDLDPSTLGLSPEQIHSSDLAHLWFLHVALQAIKDAKLDPDRLSGERMGVYVGHARGSPLVADITYSANIESLVGSLPEVGEWKTLPVERQKAIVRQLVEDTHRRYPRMDDTGGPFTQPNAVAGLVARRLQTSGPYLAVDAACASSFAALDLAARAIHAGKIDSALVGGCSYNQWSSVVMFCQAQALSANGSFPFDHRADGFISSDGYAAVLMEPLERALAAGRRVLAVIRAIGSSCDGRGKSLWAPLKEGQVEAVRRAYRDDLTPDTIQAIEAHATGTKVGDATEVSALAEVFSKLQAADAQHRLPIFSVKGNIGHTRETAGMAGLIKMVLAMQQGTIPPAAGYEAPSPEVDWSRVPFRVPTCVEPWPERPNLPKRCAVDAFGIGGLNYHVVVEEGTNGREQGIGDRGPEKEEHPPISVANPQLPTPSSLPSQSPVAMVGLGCVLPEAFNFQDFRRNLAKPRVLQLPPPERWSATLYLDPAGGPYRIREARGYFLNGWQFDWRKFKIPPKSVQFSDPLQFMLIDAVAQAFEQTGQIAHPPVGHERTGVYVGSIFGSDYTSQLNIGLRLGEFERDLVRHLHDGGCPAEESERIAHAALEHLRSRFPIQDEAGSFSSSTLASRIAKHFDFRGPTAAVDAEEAGGLAALAAAVDCLRAGDCDVAVCAGGQRTMHYTRFESYDRMGRLAREGHEGFYLAEGAVAVVLRRLEDAKKDGQAVLAVLHDVQGRSQASGGTHDQPVSGVLATIGGQAQPLPTATAKIGMTQGATGLVELAHSLVTLADNKDQPAEPIALELENVGLRGLIWQAKLEAYPSAMPSVGTGVSSARSEVSVVAPPKGPHVIRLAATDSAALRERVASALQDSASLWQTGGLSRPYDLQDEYRLVIVADSPATLSAKLNLVRELPMGVEAWPALHEQGVFLHRRPESKPALALVFPGQGSQYSGMLKGLLERYSAETRSTLDEINAVLQQLGQPTFQQIAWEPAFAERLGVDTWLTQASVYSADMLMFSVLQAFGVADAARLIFAHSYGEYPALAAAGAWTLKTGLLATFGRCQALAALGDSPGKLISTSADRKQTADLVQRFAGQGLVAPANFNSPEQTVLAVVNALVEPVLAAIEQIGQTAKLLPVPQPYHSALLASAQPALQKVLAPLPLTPPRVPLLSSIGNEYVAEPDDIRRRLVDQFVAPLYFPELVERAYADGVRVFVEVGPRTVATRLIRSILRTQPAMAICTDHPKVPAVEQLLRVQALLETQDLLACRTSILPVFDSRTGILPVTNAEISDRQDACPTGLVIPYSRTRTLPLPVKEGIAHFDATARRRSRSGLGGQVEPHVSGAEKSNGNGQHNQIEQFLIQFVCEQTGYPPEVVSLDQDLEADLGIDSIKKAQLLGELREQYQIKMPAGASGLSLSQFVTLRDISQFLADKLNTVQAVSADESAITRPTPQPRPAVVTATGGNGQGNGSVTNTRTTENGLVQVCRFSGTPGEMGYRHGQLFGQEIRATLKRYTDLLGPNALELDTVREAVANDTRFFDEAGLEELRGLSAGSGVPYASLVALNLGLEPEHSLALSGCTQLAIRAASNHGAGLIHAANEDSPIALRLGNHLARFVQIRHPTTVRRQERGGNGNPNAAAPASPLACCLFGGPGQIGGINGLNQAGLVVTSTMLLDQPRDLSSVGQVHPVLVLHILEEAAGLEAAIEIIRRWPRVGAWSLLLSHAPSDRIAYIEYDEKQVQVEENVDVLFSTNHSRLLAHGDVPEHSLHRLERMEKVLSERPLTSPAVEALLRDRMDLARGRMVAHRTMNTVCRVDNQISFVYSAADGGRFCTTPGPAAGEACDQFTGFDLPALWREDAPASDEGTALIPTGQVMRRWVLRSVPDETPAATGPIPALDTLIIGSHPLAETLAKRLSEAGSKVSITTGKDGTPAFQQVRRLILLAAPEKTSDWTASDAKARTETLHHSALEPFAWVQKWIAALQETPEGLAGAQLLAVTQLGADFGTSPHRPMQPAGGALTGLCKALAREYPSLTVKVLDTLKGEPAPVLAQSVLGVLSTDDSRLENAALRNQRQRLLLVPQDLPTFEPGVVNPPAGLIEPGTSWIVTGGGRGISAQVARALALRFGVHLHLWGTTPLETIPEEWLSLDPAGRKKLRGQIMEKARQDGQNPQAVWRKTEKAIELSATLAEHRQAGVSHDYHPVDLADAEAVANVLHQIRGSGRPIRGILHGAGVELSGDFVKKSLETVRATLHSKVLGLQHLLALIQSDPIGAIVTFGSVSGRFGGLGQTDYSLASDLLAKFLAAYRKETGIPCTTFCWPAWGELGMAMRAESRFALEAGGQKFMPVQEGVAHVVRELLAGLPESEVVILDRPGVLDSDRIAIGIQANEQITRLEPLCDRQALLSGWQNADPRSRTAEAVFDPRRDAFLLDHQFEGHPILPAVIGLETLAEAALIEQPVGVPFQLADVTIHAGLRFYSHLPVRAKAVVADAPQTSGNGSAAQNDAAAKDVRMVADFFTKNGKLSQPDRLLVSAVVSLQPEPLSAQGSAAPTDLTWADMQYPASLAATEPGRVYHGPALRTLRQIGGNETGAWGELVVPDPAALRRRTGILPVSDASTGILPVSGSNTSVSPVPPIWRLPAALLDGCLVACGVFGRKRLGLMSLPAGADRLIVLRMPQAGEICQVCVRYLDQQERHLRFDFDLFGPDGVVLLAARGYRTVVLQAGTGE